MRLKSIGIVGVLCCGLATGSALADRGWYGPQSSVQFDLHYGTGWGRPSYPSYGYWPHIYTPPVIIAAPPPQTVYIERPAPPVYIEQAPPPAAAAVPRLDPGYWYYCREAAAYYPYVKQCAGDWQKVPPTR